MDSIENRHAKLLHHLGQIVDEDGERQILKALQAERDEGYREGKKQGLADAASLIEELNAGDASNDLAQKIMAIFSTCDLK